MDAHLGSKLSLVEALHAVPDNSLQVQWLKQNLVSCFGEQSSSFLAAPGQMYVHFGPSCVGWTGLHATLVTSH